MKISLKMAEKSEETKDASLTENIDSEYEVSRV